VLDGVLLLKLRVAILWCGRKLLPLLLVLLLLLLVSLMCLLLLLG
jgi:hypothetical protein